MEPGGGGLLGVRGRRVAAAAGAERCQVGDGNGAGYGWGICGAGRGGRGAAHALAQAIKGCGLHLPGVTRYRRILMRGVVVVSGFWVWVCVGLMDMEWRDIDGNQPTLASC